MLWYCWITLSFTNTELLDYIFNFRELLTGEQKVTLNYHQSAASCVYELKSSAKPTYVTSGYMMRHWAEANYVK